MERFEDGSHIVFVNGAYRSDEAVGKLMHDFSCTNPADMNYDILARRVDYFKNSSEGVKTMCKSIEDMRAESFKEGMEEGEKKGIKKGMQAAAMKMIKAGKYALDEIVSISGLSLDEVKKLAAE